MITIEKGIFGCSIVRGRSEGILPPAASMRRLVDGTEGTLNGLEFFLSDLTSI